MKIKTKYFGEAEIAEHEIIHFPDGIFGFEDNKQFVIIRFDEEDDCFLCLQSTRDEMLAFVLMNPFCLDPDYAAVMTDDELRGIKATPETPLLLYVITVVKDPFNESTVNLKCPIAVNAGERIAKQIILETKDYSLRHPITLGKAEA